MVETSRRSLLIGAAAITATAGWRPYAASQAPLSIEITEGVVEPMPFAAPVFVPDTPDAAELAELAARVVADDLVGTGLFSEIPAAAHVGRVTNFDAPVQFADWRAINAQALVTGAVSRQGNEARVRFRLWDVFAQGPVGEGLQFDGPAATGRRMGHKVADTVYARLTGEGGYFDSRVAFVAESGPKDARRKAISVMDYDGANARALTDGAELVLAPRFSRAASQILYTSYERGQPALFVMDGGGGGRRSLGGIAGMAFAPRFSPAGGLVAYSVSEGGATDIYVSDLSGGAARRLTQTSAIDTAPAFSPDAAEIVFESDRGGTQQLYVMDAGGGGARRISFGEGRYATPVRSPRGDLVAFTKMVGGRFHIGVMRLDGSGERLLTASYLDEGPTWAPNGRVIMFYRESPGEAGGPQLYSVDVTGRNLRAVATAGFASDPSWSGLLS
ncbi:Tol-Pal system beta propeller repeat protein TolB [soil metagenome]